MARERLPAERKGRTKRIHLRYRVEGGEADLKIYITTGTLRAAMFKEFCDMRYTTSYKPVSRYANLIYIYGMSPRIPVVLGRAMWSPSRGRYLDYVP